MVIETVGKIQNILGNHQAGDWVKKTDINSAASSDFARELEKMNTGISLEGNLGVDAVAASSESVQMQVPGKKNFLDMVANSITEVNDLQQEANKAIQKLVSGESKNIQETMIAVEKADMAFKTMNQIRMKVLDAYREVMKMQV